MAPRRAGLSLLEVTFALAILGFALLASLAILGQRARFEGTLDAHRQASRSLTIALESLQAGLALPTVPTPASVPTPWSPALPPNGMLWSVRRPTGIAGLEEVEIVVRYSGVGRTHFDRRTTLVRAP